MKQSTMQQKTFFPSRDLQAVKVSNPAITARTLEHTGQVIPGPAEASTVIDGGFVLEGV